MQIGILSLYYKNHNYGGLLQAYALCRVVTKLGLSVEQICHERAAYQPTKLRMVCSKLKRLAWYSLHWQAFRERLALEKINPPVDVRLRKFEEFEQECIPHTDIVYVNANLAEAFEKYDAVVVGSDQVWNFDWTPDEYLLEHVPDGIKKVSYAASMGRTYLREIEKDRFGKYLFRFAAVGVREQDTVALLQPYAGKNKVEWVLDPTMLLTSQDWEEICPKRRVDGKYLFCYFLGPDANMRKVASEYAKKHDLKIVTLPHLTGKIFADIGFGDEQLYDVSPAYFLSLIKYAEYVITDSFHGSVISLLYHKQFCTFSRLNMPHMDNRMVSLLEMFDTENRFLNISKRMTTDYMERLQPIDYSKPFPKFEKMKEKSLKFLRENLKE